MKRNLLFAIGCLVTAHAAYGQGQGAVIFENYNGANLIAPVTYANSPGLVPAGKEGLFVGSEFKAELGYFIGTTTDPNQLTLIPSSIGSFFGSADSSVEGGNGGAGFFQLGAVNIPGVTSPALASAVTFEVFVWNSNTGASYDASSQNGRSQLFTISIGGTGSPPAGIGDFGASLLPFSVYGGGTIPFPEPSTLAIGGLGAAGLLLFRRRK